MTYSQIHELASKVDSYHSSDLRSYVVDYWQRIPSPDMCWQAIQRIESLGIQNCSRVKPLLAALNDIISPARQANELDHNSSAIFGS